MAGKSIPGYGVFLLEELDKRLNKVHNEVMARYDSLRKLERNKALREFKESHPDLSYKEIGVVFGVSEARAWVIINRKNENRAKR